MTMRRHPNIEVTDADGVRTIRIDREEKLGALSSEIVRALGVEFAETATNESARALVLTGTGRGFVAGADIGEYKNATKAYFSSYQRRSREVFDSLERMPQPTIAAVNGFAFGGGFELALCCDVIIASENARFALPEVNLGLIPGGGGTQRLARAGGVRWAKELVMTGRVVRPAEALSRGLVTEVVKAEELGAKVHEFALSIAGKAPIAVQTAKRVIDEGHDMSLSDGLSLEQDALDRVFDTLDAQEGIAAFIEKRDPQFRGL